MARYALVIGIAEYLSPSLPRLPKTTNDAEAIAQLLEQYGDFQSVQRLPQRWNKDKNGYEMAASKVTGAEIGQKIKTFLLEQAANNEALIYFSGHGFTISDNLGQQKGYLASSDCQIEFKDNENVEQKYGIDLDSLNDLIRYSQLSSLVMLLDCCHSGYFLEKQLIERTLNAFSKQKDYYLITACRRFERAGVIKGEEYSIFTGAVLRGLAAENAGSSRRISSDRLFDFVSNELKGSVQEPIRMGLGSVITLITYPQSDIPKEEVAFNRENPYRGLYAFEFEQAQYFGGREQAVRTLILRLVDSRFLAVIGYSGSGKSSLVKAGLLPQLQGNRLPGSSEWAIASFTPGEHPLGKLVDILARQQQNQPYVLFIDQFEEIFTLCEDEEERKAFIHSVVQEVKAAEKQTRIILTMRGDFLNKCAEYLEIITLINSDPPTAFIVTPMSFSELQEAIEKPANLHGVTFEHGLVSQIAQDIVGQPGALPLLQYALKELWRVCIEEPESPQPLLTRIGYEEIGGVIGALDKRATILYQSFTAVDQKFVQSLFMELVQLNESGQVTRRRISWERLAAVADSPQQLQRVIGLLAGSQQRLIITDEKTIEVAHEALISEWKLLNSWIAEDLENIRLHRSLEEDYQEWQEIFNKSDDALLTGAKLAVISEWVEKTQPRLTPQEVEFLQKSLKRRDREIQAELEHERQLRELAESRQQEAEARAKAETEKTQEARNRVKAERQKNWWLSLAVVSLTVVAVLAIGLKQQANQREKAVIEALISKPQQLLNVHNQLEALIESVKVLKYLKKIGAEQIASTKSLQNIISQSKERNRLEGHSKKVNDVSVSPDGSMIASASDDKTVIIWDKEGKQLFKQPLRHDSEVWAVTFSNDGNLLASGDADGVVKIWNSRNGKLIRKFPPPNDVREEDRFVFEVSFSHDDRTIGSANWDNTVKIWNIADGNLIKTLPYGNKVNTVNFNLDGGMIAAGGDDKPVKIWRTKDWQLLKTLPNGKVVYGVSFSPDGEMLASASEDKTVKVWDVASEKIKRTFDHQDSVYAVSFSQDGNMLASASKDKTVKIWSIPNGNKLEEFWHSDSVNSVTFSRQDQMIVSSHNKIVTIWSINSNTSDIKVKNRDELLKYSCDLLQNYLTNSKNSQISKENKHICDDFYKR